MLVPPSVDRARELWSSGERRAALHGLAARVRADPADADARMALVGFYRELGAPDQAGRWAAAFEGVADRRELDRLARLLAASGVYAASAPAFLALPRGRMSQELEDLLAGPVEHYRGRLQQYAVRPGQRRSRAESVTETAMGAWFVTVVALLLGGLAVWLLAFLGTRDIGAISRIGAVVLLVLLGIATTLSGIVLALERKWRAIAWIIAGIVPLALAVAFLVTGLRLPWEG